MRKLKVGVMIESFRLGVKAGIRKAAEIGADGFQIYVIKDEMAPWNLSKTGRREFRKLVDGLGLTVSALCGDLGHGGYTDPNGLDEKIDKTRQILDLSADLAVPIVTTHIGVIPDDPTSPVWNTMKQALSELGAYAEKVGSCFATETGPEAPVVMRKFVNDVGSPALRINYDPANLVMRGFDYLGGVGELSDLIVHTHAKDAVRNPDGTRREVALGDGHVKWPEYIAALESVGYDGFYTIEREVGDDPVADIVKALQFLRSFGA